MKNKHKKNNDHCTAIGQKRLELDIAFCNANYDSHDARINCYCMAEADSEKRGMTCKYSS